MKEITFRIPEEVLAQVDKEAGLKHISRAQFIRDRLVPRETKDVGDYSPKDFHTLVSLVRRRTGNGMDKRQLENVVAIVFNELAS
jgi:hypothetical protein